MVYSLTSKDLKEEGKVKKIVITLLLWASINAMEEQESISSVTLPIQLIIKGQFGAAINLPPITIEGKYNGRLLKEQILNLIYEEIANNPQLYPSVPAAWIQGNLNNFVSLPDTEQEVQRLSSVQLQQWFNTPHDPQNPIIIQLVPAIFEYKEREVKKGKTK